MSKWVTVRCVSSKDVMIEIENFGDQDDALQVAQSMMNDYDDFEAEDVKEKDIETYKRHADEVFSL